jgi:hypothetical protein
MRDLKAGETQCTARSKRTGQRCKRPSALGSNVCRSHGSEAPQCRERAKRRLEQAADVLVQRLLGMALDGEPNNVALQAVIAALDRAGMSPKHLVDVGVGPRTWEVVFDDISTDTRSESRARRGVADPAPPFALPGADVSTNAWDGEVIDAEPEPMPNLKDLRPEPIPRRYDMRPPVQAVTGDEAVAAAARARREMERRYPQKALPAPVNVYTGQRG